MKRRSLLTLIPFGGWALGQMAVVAAADPVKKVRYVVPKDVTKINVKSYKENGSQVLDYNFSVEAGQKFEITPL